MNLKKLASFTYDGCLQWGAVNEEETGLYSAAALNAAYGVQLPATLAEFVGQGEGGLAVLKDALRKNDSGQQVTPIPLADVRLEAPLGEPRRNIFCIGENYAEHVGEFEHNFNTGVVKELPKFPVIFTKATSAVIGPEGLIDPHEGVTEALDYEGEVVVIIGKTGANISQDDAMDYVYGYTIMDDVSARDLQNNHGQWFHGKSLDTFAPMGPYILLQEAAPEYFEITTKVNGEVRQHSTTKSFIFPIPKLIQTLSEGTTLYAGDLIATGTPSGVGVGFNPPKYIHSGDKVEITVSGIGTLANTVK